MTFIDTARITFVLDPASGLEAGAYFLSCNLLGWHPALPEWRLRHDDARTALSRDVPVGTLLEFRVTRGSEASEEGDAYGARRPPRRLHVRHDETVVLTVEGWRDRPRPGRPSTLSGNVRSHFLDAPEPAERREVVVSLPPSYHDTDERSPVLCLHDGDNVFDAARAYHGVEWGGDEAAEALSRDGLEAFSSRCPSARTAMRSTRPSARA